MSLGPRVGGAHVDVNMKLDDTSISRVGKQIHKQLSQLGSNLQKVGERNGDIYQAIGKDSVRAWRSLLGTVVTSAPLMGSAISGVAGAATMLAGAMYSTTQSSFALLPIMTSLGLAGLTASIGMRNFGAAVSETNPKALKELLEGMPKSMQEAVMSTRALSNEMRAAIWPKLFAGLSKGIDSLRETGVIQRGLGLMADSLNGLAKSVLNYANTKQGVSTLNKFFENNAKVFAALSKAVVPFLDGFLRLVNALTPAAIRLSGRITDVAKSFQSWTKEAGFGKRIDDMMKGAEKTAGLLFKVLGNLGAAIRNIFNAANPSTNTFLQMLVDVTQRFEDWTSSIGGKNSIATWAAQSVDVMRQFGHTAEAAFKVIAELADPRIIISFLKTVEGAFDLLGKLPLEKIVSAFATLAETLQPVSSLFLAIVIGGAALNILIGSLIGQVGGLFSILAKIVKFKIILNLFKGMGTGAGAAGAGAADAAKKTGLLSRAWAFLLKIMTKVKSAFSGVVGFFSKTSTATGQAASKAGALGSALKPVMGILGKFLKFAGPVGIAVWIGTIIAKSESLQKKLGGVWDAMKGAWSSLVGAFKEIGTALKPLAPVAEGAGKAFGFVFDILDKIASIGIGLILDTIIFAFKSLGKVLKGVGKIIAGTIDLFVGLFTWDGSKMLDGLKKIGSGIVPLLQGIFGLFVTFFAPARLFKVAGIAFKGLLGGIAKAVPAILGFLGRFLVSVLKFFVTLAPKLLVLGGKALASLGKAVVKGAPGVLSKIGSLVKGVIGWIARLPGRLLELGKTAITKLGGAVVSGTPKILKLAGDIFMGIVKWIAKLPGRLLELGKNAVTKLAGSIKDGVGRLTTAAGKIFGAIWDEIKGLPGELLNLGKAMIGGLVDGIGEKLQDLKDMASDIGGAIKDVLPGSPVKSGPLVAWNHGSGATGGGRNIIDAITGGLKNTDPIRKAMADVADAVSGSLSPTVDGKSTGVRAREGGGRLAENTSGGNVYIGKMEPHNYGEFERQMREKTRLAALGGRRPVSV